MNEPTGLILELRSRITSARKEPSPVLSRGLLKKTVKECTELIQQNIFSSECAVIASSALSELARLENHLKERLRYRREAIKICKYGIAKNSTPQLVISYADRIVDHFFDEFAREEKSLINSSLADSKLKISGSLQKVANINDRILLLAQMASVLRCQSLASEDLDIRERRATEAVRCSELAVREAPQNPYSHLALGQSLWLNARMAKNDVEFFELMNNAERAFLIALNDFDPLPDLVIARFYRQTYRPALAVKAFLAGC